MRDMGGNLAIIPVRTGSRRLHQKNIKHFFGKPIFIYTLEYAKRSGLFDEILVSTESEEVVAICRPYGHDVPFLRPERLASDSAQLVHVVADALQEYERRGKVFENFCMLWATAPMRTDVHIREAFGLLDDAEAVIGATYFDRSVFSGMRPDETGLLSPLFPELLRQPSVKQPEVVVDNCSMVWVRTSAFHEHGTWLPPKLKAYMMPRRFSVDIDTAEDWELAEFYWHKYILCGDEEMKR